MLVGIVGTVACCVVLSGLRSAGARHTTSDRIFLRSGLAPDERMTVHLERLSIPQAKLMYAELTGRNLLPRTTDLLERLDDLSRERLSQWRLIRRQPRPSSGIEYHRDGSLSALEVKERLESFFNTQGLAPVPEGSGNLRIVRLESNPGGRAPN